MKELSIAEKAKAYDEALEKARKLCAYPTTKPFISDLQDLFPELKESGDERIRKELIDYFKENNAALAFKGISNECVIAWLEKQGEQKHQYKSRPRYVGEEKLLGVQQPADKVEPKFKVGDWIVRELDNTWYQIKNCILNVTDNKYGYDLTSGGYISSQDANFYHLWTIQDAKDGDVLAAHECLVLFKEIDGLNIRCYCTYHYLNHQKFYVDTLQNKTAFCPATKEQRDTLFAKMKEADYEWDAKKKELKKVEQKPVKVPKFKVGDFIQFNGMGHTRYTVKEVCGLSHYINTCNKRMDMSYTDANFELVEQKTWSEEDERLLRECIVAVSSSEYHTLNEKDLIEEWCNSLKYRIQPQSEWTKEEKDICLETIKLLETANHPNKIHSNGKALDFTKNINWLKSLRPQSHWKPSEEQMKALWDSIPENVKETSEREMLLDSLYQDLKKL